MIEFYHQKETGMLKLGCTLPNLANICIHKSTDSMFYPFTEPDKDLLEKIREEVLGVPPLSSHARLRLTKLLSVNQRICANHLSA